MMIKALAPRTRRGCSRVWLSIVLAGLIATGAAVVAQDTPKSSGAATKKGDSSSSKKGATTPGVGASQPPASKTGGAPPTTKGADAAKKAADVAPDEDADQPAQEGSEVYKDPRAEKALTIFKTVPGLRPTSPQIIAEVRRMAAGESNPDPDTIEKFVLGMAYELTQRSNINALINPPPGQPSTSAAARAIQVASDNLLDALNTARAAQNATFLNAYVKKLIEVLPKLLDNNLVARTEAVIVLGQTGSPEVVPILLGQLKDPNQTVQVKLWAVRGITGAVGNGTRVSTLSAADAITAGKTISDFLEREKDTLWFLQMRGLEGLGSMRQAAVPTSLQKAEMATTAMKFLGNPDARPEVRSAAAWALGMLQVNPSITRYNFPLIAYDIGRLVAELGEKSNASFKTNPTRSQALTGLLVSPIYQAFNGVEGARESGLLHSPALGQSQSYVSKVADLSASVARASIELLRAPGGQQKARQAELSDRVAALKDYLDKNPPKDFRLVPGGPEFRPKQAQVADAPAGARKLAGAAAGK